MTRHLDAVSVTEHRVVLALAREFADRAEKAEATIQRVRRRAEGPTPAVQGDWMAGYASAMRDVLRALEGDKR